MLKETMLVTIGVIFGTVAGYKYAELKYKTRIDDEIQQARDLYSKKIAEINADTKEYVSDVMKTAAIDSNTPHDKSTISYKSNTSESVSYHNFYPKRDLDVEAENGEMIFDSDKSVINEITQEEYDDINGYTKFNYIFYTDGIVTDITEGANEEEILDDPEMLLGYDNLEYILNSNKQVLWFRNDIQSADFEILKETETYYDVVGKSPSEDDG